MSRKETFWIILLFGRALLEESTKRNPENIRPIVVLMDGQLSLWEAAKRLSKERIEILDLLHVTPRIWDAANLFCTLEDEKIDFVKNRVLRILEGKIKLDKQKILEFNEKFCCFFSVFNWYTK